MSHPRALDETKAKELEQWFAEYEALRDSLGSVSAKCKELGISRVTFYDTIARVRGNDTKQTREKLSNWQMQELVDSISGTAGAAGVNDSDHGST